jgi:hypothetical protein
LPGFDRFLDKKIDKVAKSRIAPERYEKNARVKIEGNEK